VAFNQSAFQFQHHAEKCRTDENSNLIVPAPGGSWQIVAGLATEQANRACNADSYRAPAHAPPGLPSIKNPNEAASLRSLQ
jgi:hypothetical protein